jgi:O-antigen ligase
VFLSGLLLAASVIVEVVVGRHLAWFGVPNPNVDALVFRPTGFTGNALVAGAILAVILSLCLSSPNDVRGRALMSGVYIVAIFATLTRSAMIGAAVAVIFFIFTTSRGRKRMHLLRFLTLFAGIPAIIWLYTEQSADIAARLGGTLSDDLRQRAVDSALRAFWENPVLGLGLGGYKRSVQNAYGPASMLSTADNMFLTISAELGAVGLLFLLIAALRITAARRKASAKGHLGPILVWCVVALFFDALYHDGMEFVLVIALLRLTVASPLTAPEPPLARPSVLSEDRAAALRRRVRP